MCVCFPQCFIFIGSGSRRRSKSGEGWRSAAQTLFWQGGGGSVVLKGPAENKRRRKLWGEWEGKQSWMNCWGGWSGSTLWECFRRLCLGRLFERCTSLLQGAPFYIGNEYGSLFSPSVCRKRHLYSPDRRTGFIQSNQANSPFLWSFAQDFLAHSGSEISLPRCILHISTVCISLLQSRSFISPFCCIFIFCICIISVQALPLCNVLSQQKWISPPSLNQPLPSENGQQGDPLHCVLVSAREGQTLPNARNNAHDHFHVWPLAEIIPAAPLPTPWGMPAILQVSSLGLVRPCAESWLTRGGAVAGKLCLFATTALVTIFVWSDWACDGIDASRAEKTTWFILCSCWANY